MRTLRTLAAAAAVLLVAGSASAGIILTVRAAAVDNSPDIEVEVDVELVNLTEGLSVFQFSFLHNGGTPANSAGVGNAADAGVTCVSAAPSYGCNWPGQPSDFVGGQNNGNSWLWDISANPPPNSTFLGIAHFATNATSGTISLGNFEIYDETFITPITDVTVHPYVIPEPTTAALLGLGLFGLVLGGRRR